MKFISWNVNGIRAVLKKNFNEFLDDTMADIYAFQETKISEGILMMEREGYHEYWNYAEKKGYSGTMILTKTEPINVTYGLGIAEHDTEGRVITLEYEDFFFVNVYTPNAQDGLKRIKYRQDWEDAFRDYLSGLRKTKGVVVCGDLNVAHNEIDLKNPKANVGKAGFSDEEREKFNMLLDSGFIDTFRYFYPDLEDKYSWWSYRTRARSRNAGWRIDYFLVSKELEDNIKDAAILDDVLGSDHCPVSLDIEF